MIVLGTAPDEYRQRFNTLADRLEHLRRMLPHSSDPQDMSDSIMDQIADLWPEWEELKTEGQRKGFVFP